MPPATLTGSYTDIGLLDRHVVTINWGDGTANSTGAATVDAAGGDVGTLDGWCLEPTLLATNAAPVAVGSIADQSDAEGDAVSLATAASFSDADGDALDYAASGLPNGASIDAVSGVVSGTLAVDSAGTYAVTITASDASDSATQSFTWTVTETNQAPAPVGSIADQSDAEGDVVSLATAANFSDADGDTLAYAASGLPNGLSIDAATGAISGTLAAAREWTAIALAVEEVPTSPPGTRFVYSDINFFLLGHIVSRVTGTPLEAYVQRAIFGPLRRCAASGRWKLCTLLSCSEAMAAAPIRQSQPSGRTTGSIRFQAGSYQARFEMPGYQSTVVNFQVPSARVKAERELAPTP